MAPSHTEKTRRRLLKSIGATGLAFGATGVSTATVSDSRTAKLNAAYGSADAAERVLDDRAGPVLAELADRGVIESASAAAFDLSDATLSATDDGAKLVATADTDAGEVTLAVRPEESESVASVEPADDGTPFTLRSADDDVSTEDHCYYEYDCTNYPCSDGSSAVYLKRHCCEYSDETKCSSWEKDGCCL